MHKIRNRKRFAQFKLMLLNVQQNSNSHLTLHRYRTITNECSLKRLIRENKKI